MRLQELRKLKNITQSKLASEIGVSRSTIAMWENGASEPSNDLLGAISDFFGVSVDYILGRDEVPESDLSTARRADGWIPVIGNVAAGIPASAIEAADPDDWEQLSPDEARNGQHIALRINGASMEPRMKIGDVVIVRLQETAEDGDIAIVKVNGDDATCKKIKKTPEGLFLLSFNPGFEPIYYSAQQVRELPVQILGKVVELRAKF